MKNNIRIKEEKRKRKNGEKERIEEEKRTDSKIAEISSFLIKGNS